MVKKTCIKFLFLDSKTMRKSSRRKKINQPVGRDESSLSGENEEAQAVIEKPQDRVIQNNYPTVSFSINWDSLSTRRKITSEMKDEVFELYYDVQKKPKDAIERLLKLIEDYPDISIFYNYLENCYRELDETEKWKEIAGQTVKKFSDLMFGKISQIELALEAKDLSKIPDIIDNKYDFRLLYPEKATFHIVEVICFNYAMGKYFALRSEVDKATIYLENIKSVDEDHVFVKDLSKFIDKNSGLKFYQKVLKKLKK